MPELFSIETDELWLTWATRSATESERVPGVAAPPGRLLLTPRRPNLRFGANTRRSEVPERLASDPLEHIGPRLFEQTDYSLYLRSKSNRDVSLETRDPVLIQGLGRAEQGRVIHGVINFGSQVGKTEFDLKVGSQAELTFEVEVFPAKLDYATDYQELVAEVQEILTGLVLEYLRSTFNLGSSSTVPQATELEWLTLLRHVASDLSKALSMISNRPQWALAREPRLSRVEHLRQAGSATRSAIRSGKGAGILRGLVSGVAVRERLPESLARPTLDTPEHRWLASQLTNIRRQLARLRLHQQRLEQTLRNSKILAEIDSLLGLVGRALSAEPIKSAAGSPPPAFASLQLLRAPGYREAYRAWLILSLGLRIDGGPTRLGIKDLSVLYEYWCLLALVRLLAEEMGQPLPPTQLLTVQHQGLRVVLEKGREHSVSFVAAPGRKVSLTYNPIFQGLNVLTAQQPDMVLTLEDADWPPVRLVLDAKYRIDLSQRYATAYGSPGPPEDSVNVLHRYRDAILELDRGSPKTGRPKRTVIQAAALFPYREVGQGDFGRSRLWEALGRLGVGALPFLPGDTSYVRDWLRENLRSGGWRLADRAIPHRSLDRASDWRSAAARSVLVGVLRPDARQHLGWIQETSSYFVPASKTQRRQYATSSVAIYSPVALREPGSVAHVAEVLGTEVLARGEINTPWGSEEDPDRPCVLYRLGELRMLAHPIVNRPEGGVGSRFSISRWTTILALERAKTLTELFLETEPEWRLYEELRALSVSFRLSPGRPVLQNPDDPRGRAWFVTDAARSQYRGAAGFLIRSEPLPDRYYSQPERVAELL